METNLGGLGEERKCQELTWHREAFFPRRNIADQQAKIAVTKYLARNNQREEGFVGLTV